MFIELELPKSAGYRMPAEWENHDGTWLSWPHNLETWPVELEEVEFSFTKIVHNLTQGEMVHINVNDREHEYHVRELLSLKGTFGNVLFHHIPTNDAWIRDHGAIFLSRGSLNQNDLLATNWIFNSWGGKYPPWDLDNAVPVQMAEVLGVPVLNKNMILEGGSIEVNGSGCLLTTERCLLNPNRNPHLSREDIESELRNTFGVDQILWLADGIAGDDTDGHIDDIARFVRRDTLVAAVEEDPGDINYHILKENFEALRHFHLLNGDELRIIPLPMPSPIYIRGERMPASYANFYIANDVVLLPVYRDPEDQEAIRIIQSIFPDRNVVPIPCNDVIWGLGAVHCLTQQVPQCSLSGKNESLPSVLEP